MLVVLHTGVHCTDEGSLLRCLLRNADDLRDDCVAIPGPGTYREFLSDTLNSLGDGPPATGAREVLLDGILGQDPDSVGRLILSHENLFSVPKLALSGGRLYRKAERRLETIARIFEGDRIALYMGIRNPVTFLPALLRATPHATLDELLCGADPAGLCWSDLILRIRRTLPGIPVTVWCDEDTPFVWGEIMREMAGVPPTRALRKEFHVFGEIISDEGLKRFRGFLDRHPRLNEVQKRRVLGKFLERYARADAIEEELDLPGWDAAFVARLTRIYERDVQRLEAMDGIDVITP